MYYLWTFLVCLAGAMVGYAIGGYWVLSRARHALYRLQYRIEARQKVLDTAIGLFRAEVQRATELEVKRNGDV